jgi:hypothetical protein
MAFNDVLVQDGIGWVWLVDVSFDDFATVSYRWGTFSFDAGSNHYQARIPAGGLTKFQRGFGQENASRAGTVTLTLENTDFGADWLVDRATVASQVFRARFKLTLAIYPNGDTSSYQTKVTGTFKCIDMPYRDRERVVVQLADDTMGLFDRVFTSPTVREWRDDTGSTATTCPLHESYAPSPNPSLSWDEPLPLAFGHGGRLNCLSAEIDHGSEGVGGALVGAMDFCRAIMVCATTSPENANSDDVKYLWGVYRDDALYKGKPSRLAGKSIGIPKTFKVPEDLNHASAGLTITIWEPQKTQTLTKDGVDWKLLWVKFQVQAYRVWFSIAFASFDLAVATQDDGSPVIVNIDEALPYVGTETSLTGVFSAFSHFQVLGRPLSARTAVNSDEQLGVDVVRDLICYYSEGGTDGFDLARYGSARQMNQVPVTGIVQPQRPQSNALSDGQMRQTLSDICQSSDLDLALTWEGKIGIYSSHFSFADITATRVTISETRCTDVVERIPSKGERWAPYNRVYVVSPDGVPYGPFDNPDPDVDWGVTLERTVYGKWAYPFEKSDPLYSNMVWYSYRRLESVVRPVVRFVTDREGLKLDLGDLFDFTWTRGGSGGPYNTAAVFRVESMTVDPETLAVGIEAVWVDDIQTSSPYLLDDESLLLRWSGSGGGTLTVEDGNDGLVSSGGGFVSEGVAAGDIVVLKDSSQADNVFTRYRKLRIVSVDGDADVTVESTDLDFDAPAPVAIASGDWYIERGATTYPSSSSDPTSYPSDGDMYGKACDDDDQFSDDSNANRLG